MAGKETMFWPEVFEPAVADPGIGVERDGLEVGEGDEDLLAQRPEVVVVHRHGLHAGVGEERYRMLKYQVSKWVQMKFNIKLRSFSKPRY